LLPCPSALAADDKESVLRKLDAAAAGFSSTTADFQFDSVETDPIPDKDIQKGTVYYERKGTAFQMGVHINEVNGKKVPKVYTYSHGQLRLFEPLVNQVTTIGKASAYESYVMLGFGASGKDLAEKWEITYLGPETLDGVKTEKLDLVAKDLNVRKNLAKVTIWVDPERGVSLKQVLTFSPGEYRVCVYFNIKTNQPLPSDAFTLKTDGKTQYVNR
jgi:outer membrane lipoprotein-sorting protein